jgi:single-strand DNA-binding protein
MNNVSILGRLTRDPNLVHHDDRPICELRVAVDNGRHPTTFVDVRTFDGQAYVCAEYLAKGERVAVSGSLVSDEWRGADDSFHQRHSIIGHVEFLDKLRTEPGPEADKDAGARSEQPVAA